MRMTLELHGIKFSVEESGDGFNADELKEMFSRMLVQATYSPEVIDLADGFCYKCKCVKCGGEE